MTDKECWSVALNKATSLDEVAYHCREFSISIGFVDFLLAVTVPGVAEDWGKITLTSRSNDWVAMYNAFGAVEFDPLVLRALSTFEPFEWWELDYESDAKLRLLFAESSRLGVCSGFTVRIAGDRSAQGVFNISTPTPAVKLGNSREAVFGQTVLFGLRVLNRVADILRSAPIDSPKTLTARQKAALQLASRGLPNKSIASKLGIGESGVEYLLRQIQDKWRVRNRSEAVSFGLKTGAIDDLAHPTLRIRTPPSRS